MSLTNVCKHCGESTTFGALFCDSCGEPLYVNEKFENLSVEELRKSRSKTLKMSIVLMITALQTIIATYPLHACLNVFLRMEVISYILMWILVGIFFLFFGLSIKLFFDFYGINSYINRIDEASRIRHSIAMEQFNAGRYKKISKKNLKELRLKFSQYNTEFNNYQIFIKKYGRKLIYYSIFFILIYSICIPLNFFLQDFYLSMTTVIIFALFVIYLIVFNREKMDEMQQELSSLVKEIKSDDRNDFIYYVEAIGLKSVNHYFLICIFFLLALIVITLLSSSVNFDYIIPA